jgi:hypothetical protein
LDEALRRVYHADRVLKELGFESGGPKFVNRDNALPAGPNGA